MPKSAGRQRFGFRVPMAVLVAATIVASLLTLAVADPNLRRAEAAPAAGFQDTVAIGGLDMPTKVQFAPDGRVFVAEKSGIIKMYPTLGSTTPTIFADLRTQTYNWWDRGLLGLAIDPNWPAEPYIYVAYAYDFDPRLPGQFPRWGTPGADSDPCPASGMSTSEGCVSLGRVSRLTSNAAGTASIAEAVLVQDFCMEFASHAMGDLRFAPDGSLLVSAGEGANFMTVDVGTLTNPPNSCGDPADAGGALRSQQVRSTQLTKPTALGGTVIRIDKTTGAGRGDNPLASSTDPNARRIIANGLRNPFRFTLRPGTNELWVGDVGWATWEEINRLPSTNPATVQNFGWPCYEGAGIMNGYSGEPLCQSLYATPTVAKAPWFTYEHFVPFSADEPCGSADSSITGVAFYQGGSYPARYQNALFFADYARRCIWVFRAGGDGAPDPATRELFVGNAGSPVDLEIGPAGDLFYVNLIEGEVRRVTAVGGNLAPTAAITANTRLGANPLTVQFDASGSRDPNPTDTLQYAWDFEGSGQFTDAATVAPVHAYTSPGVKVARVRVTDPSGATSTASTVINAGGGEIPAPTQPGWQANGTAAPGACTQLTGPTTGQTGSIVWAAPIPSTVVTASFDANIAGGTAGEGLTFALLDPSAGSGALGAGGDQLGFGGLPGVAVTLDTAKGATEPAARFVGLAQSTAGGTLTYQRTSTEVADLRGRTVHVDVIAAANRLRVFIDGRQELNELVSLPPNVLVAFTAATGGATSDRHQVCNVQVGTAAEAQGRLVVTPVGVAFGDVSRGGELTQPVTLANTGIGPVTIASVALPAAPFAVENPVVVGSIIEPGTEVIQRVRFAPDADGPAAGSYGLTAAGGAGAVSVALSGNATASTRPRATVTSPSPSLRWHPGDTISFAGSGTTSAGTPLPASALSWSVVIQHCATPASCHSHTLQTYNGVDGGSFIAPDHGYPSFLDVKLTVTSGGETSTRSIRIEPVTTTLSFDTVPSGLLLQVGAENAAQLTPFSVTAAAGSAIYLSAPASQLMGAKPYAFQFWSQGGPTTQAITAPEGSGAYVATYAPVTCSRGGLDVPIATNGSGPAAPPPGATGFQSLTPTRLFDTRLAQGEVCAGETLVARVAGRAGVPNSGVEAVALNLTVTGAQAAGYVTVWPSNQPRPNASSLNFLAGDTNANMVIVPVGATGEISLRNADDSTAMRPLHLLADVVGYFPTGSGFAGANPVRLLDTRSGNGAPAAKVGAGGQIDVQFTGRGGVPNTGVDTVVVNLTATDPDSGGYITSWPAGSTRPGSSSLNFSAGRTTPNLVLGKVGTNGRISLWNSDDSPAMAGVHLLADVTGWFPAGSSFRSQTPQRVLDTRSGVGAAATPVGAGGQIDLQLTGQGGVPASGVSAVVLNLTATNMRAPGYVTTWPAGQPRPGSSSINFSDRNVANLVIARVSPDGRISLWNANDIPAMGSVDLVADVVGWFTA